MKQPIHFLVATALFGSGCGAKGETPAAAPPAVTIGPENVAVVERIELRVGPTISGDLEPSREATLRAELTAPVKEIFAEQGEEVAAGKLLARLDDIALRDGLASAQATERTAAANLKLARRNAERTARLAGAGAIPDRELENATWTVSNAEASLADARARLATAEQQVRRTEIRAPFTGIISERQADLGDVVQSGTALFTIVDPSSMRLNAAVPAEQLASLRVGTPVSFVVTGYEGRTFTGRIERINPAADPATRQIRIYVTMPNAGRSLVAGLYAEGRVATETRTSIVVPAAAVDRRGIRPYVVRLKGGVVERVEVELGLIDEAQERVEVLTGLADGDTILLGGARGISPGTSVRVGDPAELRGGAGTAPQKG